MADQRFTKFEGIPELGSLRVKSTATETAAVHRVWSERRQIARSAARPPHPTLALRTLGYTHGQAHPKNERASLISAELVGMNDSHELWQLLWMEDMRAYCAAAGLAFPDILAKDGYSESDQWGSGSTAISWVFDVVNPDSYTKPAPGTEHPLTSTAVLTGHSMARNGVTARVTRSYRKLPTLQDWELDPQTRSWIKIERQIVPTVLAPGVPARGKDVSQHSLGTSFSMRTSRTMANGGVPASYTRRRVVGFNFPRLLLQIQQFVDINGDYRFWPRYRAPYNKQVTADVVVDFHKSLPPDSTTYKIQPVDIDYPGALFQLNIANVLTDAITVFKYDSGFYEEFILPPSTPTMRAYRGAIGTKKLIHEAISDWRFGLFRRERIFVTLE